MNITDRRRSPRTVTRLPLVVSHQSEEIATQTQNISVSGAYCTLGRFIVPMTKLEIRIELPGPPRPHTVQCHGVVVRVDPPVEQPTTVMYQAAIFFNDLSDHDRFLLSEFISQRLQESERV